MAVRKWLSCISIVFLTLSGAVVLPASAHQTAYMVDAKSGCRVVAPVPDPSGQFAVAWSGSCRNGFAQGLGRLTLYDRGEISMTLQGRFRDGKLVGRGVRWERSGEVYRGPFRNNIPNGTGTIKFSNGTTYRGQVVNGRRLGKPH